MTRDKPLPILISFLIVGGTFAALFIAETRRPLRRSENEPKLRRDARNFALASVSAVAMNLSERPIAGRLSRLVEQRQWGLLKQFPLPVWAEVTAACVLLDYTLYLWHILLHKVPLLWRFHQVHHLDLDLDASTAARFHFGELLISVLWRSGQIVLIGVSPLALSVWGTITLAEVVFHHSNLRLPLRFERVLCRMLVTPRMHGIHHSVVPEEANSNWSSGLALWDWLHGTLRLNIPQNEVTIGVAAWRIPEEVGLPNLIRLPFQEQRDSWRLPDGSRPQRDPHTTSGLALLP